MGGEQRSLKVKLKYILVKYRKKCFYFGVSRPLGQARPSRGGAGAGGRGPSRDSSITCEVSLMSYDGPL